MRTLCLSWAPFGHRLDELSKAVGGKRLNLTVLYGPKHYAPLRYFVLFLWTLVSLLRLSPDLVYVQNPPVFAPLTSLLYCRLARRKLLIDHHALWRVKTLGGGPFSKVIGLLEAFVSKSAYANTAPHSVWSAMLAKQGANRVMVVHDFVAKNPYSRDEAVRRAHANEGLLAIASHGGHPLEMIENEANAVGMVPGLTLLITGPESKLARRLSRFRLPGSVRYLGMLPMESYLRLKASCDLALNLTTEPHTLSHVLFEFAASSLPIVSSRQAVVEGVFGDSVIYVDVEDSDRVARLLADLVADKDKLLEYRNRISAKHDELGKKQEGELRNLRGLLSAALG